MAGVLASSEREAALAEQLQAGPDSVIVVEPPRAPFDLRQCHRAAERWTIAGLFRYRRCRADKPYAKTPLAQLRTQSAVRSADSGRLMK